MSVLELPKFLSLTLVFSSAWVYFNRKLTVTNILFLVHTIYIAYNLLVVFPVNVFSGLGLPLNLSTELLRARYMRTRPLDPEFEPLFQKLNSFDMRVAYLRFGHTVVAGCDYCHSFGDYALLALPRPLLSYIREIAFIGVLTLPGTQKAHLRPLGLAVLMLAGLAEAYFILTVPIAISPSEEPLILMWHDTLLRLRLALFILLPFLLHLPRIPYVHQLPIINSFVPIPPPTTPSANIPMAARLQRIQRTLDHLVPAVHLLKYTRAAVMRIPSVRNRAAAWWDNEKAEGDAVLEDREMIRTAKGVGLDYEGEDAPLRDRAREGIRSIISSVPPSDHWRAE